MLMSLLLSMAVSPMPETPDIKALITAQAKVAGVPVSWVRAFCRQESDFDPQAHVGTGTDGARGGAFGLCQITLKTAQGLGFAGSPNDLLDPTTNLRWACKLISQLRSQVAYESDQLCDVASMYNSGKLFKTALWLSENAANTADGSPDLARRARYAHTVNVYVPNVMRFASEYEKEQ